MFILNVVFYLPVEIILGISKKDANRVIEITRLTYKIAVSIY